MQNALAFRVAKLEIPKLAPTFIFLEKCNLVEIMQKVVIISWFHSRVASSKPLEPAWKLLWFAYTRYNIKMTVTPTISSANLVEMQPNNIRS